MCKGVFTRAYRKHPVSDSCAPLVACRYALQGILPETLPDNNLFPGTKSIQAKKQNCHSSCAEIHYAAAGLYLAGHCIALTHGQMQGAPALANNIIHTLCCLRRRMFVLQSCHW